jgi:ribosomal protein S18 acetylase RimI-like enzyme
MSAINTRLATLADAPLIAPLFDAYRQFYAQAADLRRAREFIDARLSQQNSIIFIAQNDQGETIGFCQCYPSFCSIIAAPIYVLNDLFVTPAARKTGAGQQLMQATEAHAKSKGIARLDLTTAKDNFSAQSLYAQQGWQRDDIYYAYNKAL